MLQSINRGEGSGMRGFCDLTFRAMEPLNHKDWGKFHRRMLTADWAA